MQISQFDITSFEGRSILHRCLQYLQNMRVQDTWFLLLISAIVAHLRLVGEIWSFGRVVFLQGCHFIQSIILALPFEEQLHNDRYRPYFYTGGFLHKT